MTHIRRFELIALLAVVLFSAQATFVLAQESAPDAKSDAAEKSSDNDSEQDVSAKKTDEDQEAEPKADQSKAKDDVPKDESKRQGDEKPKDNDKSTDKTAGEKNKQSAKPNKTSKNEDEKEKAKPKTQVRLIALSGNYVDKIQSGGVDPMSLFMGNRPMKQKSFFRLCDYLQELADDEDVNYVVFDLSDAALSMNSAQLDEFTRRMDKLNASGKKTIAWLENADNTHLAVAACCKKVLMADFGGLDMSSSAIETMYYRDAMDLIGVKASVIRAGNFKGAVEPYTNSEMSSHLRKHYADMVTTQNDAKVDRIVRGRGLTSSKVRDLQKQRFLTPSETLAAGLVDKLAPYGSMKSTVDEMVGEETEWSLPKQKRIRQMSFFEMMSTMMSGPRTSSSRVRDNTIAVLHLSGAIVDGKRGSTGVVSGPTVSAIESLAQDDKIKGIVVRINSPGGSATASESVRQALKKLAAEKPTAVSMGRVAASGGYWISCIGVPIYAEKATVTGSIGVFSMKLSYGTLLKRIGVKVETIALDDSAEAFSAHREWTSDDTATLQKTIDEVYTKFLKLVSDSRDIPLDKLEPLAGGRVWSGTQAKQIGLVDQIGGLDDCLAVIAKKASLDSDYKVIHRSAQSAGISLLELLGESDEDEIFSNVSRTAIRSLARRGLSLNTTKLLVDDALNRTNGRPTVWLLHPAEITIR
ncbi:MAG: signal peptide peptidase SppA [Planctomycetales bacterium]|nr:signal peptide peptidase SppA [Planctomycetales bacterium]